MPTIISGARDTLAINQSKRVVDMTDKISLLEPEKSPLTVLLMKLRKKKAESAKVEWLEDELMPRTDAVNEAVTSAEVAITVDTGAYFRAGDIVRNTVTGEIVYVVSVASNVITVTRNWGSSGLAAMVNGHELLILGNASEEGSNAPVSQSTVSVTKTNYTQIIRTPFEATRTNTQSKLYGGSDRNYLTNKNGIEHMVDIERTLWFGIDNEDTTNVRRSCKGILEFALQNNTALNSDGLTEDTLEDFARSVFRYGNSTKFLFCSPLTISKINGFARSKLYLVPEDKTFGITIHRYTSGHGVLNLIRTVIFEGATYDEYAVALDLENIRFRPMQDTILNRNIHSNDFDGWKDEYMTEFSMEFHQPKTHGVLTNVGGSAV